MSVQFIEDKHLTDVKQGSVSLYCIYSKYCILMPYLKQWFVMYWTSLVKKKKLQKIIFKFLCHYKNNNISNPLPKSWVKTEHNEKCDILFVIQSW